MGAKHNHYFPAGAELWLSAGRAFDGFQRGFWRESEHWAAPLSRAAQHACAPAAHSQPPQAPTRVAGALKKGPPAAGRTGATSVLAVISDARIGAGQEQGRGPAARGQRTPPTPIPHEPHPRLRGGGPKNWPPALSNARWRSAEPPDPPGTPILRAGCRTWDAARRRLRSRCPPMVQDGRLAVADVQQTCWGGGASVQNRFRTE